MIDNQDKAAWCVRGQEFERQFLEKYGSTLKVAMNPEKSVSPYAIDFYDYGHHRLADLKTCMTPFREAANMFGIDPMSAVVINRKDVSRYMRIYPGCCLYFWLTGDYGEDRVYLVSLRLLSIILLGEAPIHHYKDRVGDTRNATSSFVVDVNKFKRVA